MSKSERDHPASQYGTDIQFLSWVSYQPSVIDGEYNQGYDNKGFPRSIACHVRRLCRGAGMGIKPPFSAVPMTDRQHQLQSGRDGEFRLLRKYRFEILTPEEAAKWFENAADEILEKWIEYQTSKGKPPCL